MPIVIAESHLNRRWRPESVIMATNLNQFNRQAQVNQLPFFFFAFHPYYTIAVVTIALGVIGAVFDASVLWGVVGFWISPFVWIGSVNFVNSKYQELLDAFHGDVAAKATELFAGAGEGTQTYRIEHAYDSVRLVRPNRVYEPVTLIVGDGSLLVYDDARLRFDLLQPTLGASTREIFFDSVTSVNYDSPFFEIRMGDGDHAKYRSSRKPDDVLHDLQQRVRQYKAV